LAAASFFLVKPSLRRCAMHSGDYGHFYLRGPPQYLYF
jgi:hypothetical protein